MNNYINILGCNPERLNILFELISETAKINSFKILKNIAVDNLDFYKPKDQFDVSCHNYFESNFELKENDSFVIGVISPKSKSKVYRYFKNENKIENSQFINLIHPLKEETNR